MRISRQYFQFIFLGLHPDLSSELPCCQVSSTLSSSRMGSLSADQLVTKLKQIQQRLTDSERKAADKVIQNFVELSLPVDSEVLELCSKTGHVSASIQSRGFYKVDILNEDMPTLRNLQRNNLYRYESGVV